jgi:hypothetical protein
LALGLVVFHTVEFRGYWQERFCQLSLISSTEMMWAMPSLIRVRSHHILSELAKPVAIDDESKAGFKPAEQLLDNFSITLNHCLRFGS